MEDLGRRARGLPEPLERGECLALLAGATVGRLVLSRGGLPFVLPVPFAVGEDGVLVLVPADPELVDRVADAVVAFEAESPSTTEGLGWSVSVVGTAERSVDSAGEVLRMRHHGAVCGELVRIPFALVTGQLLPMVDPHRTAGGTGEVTASGAAGTRRRGPATPAP
ncbi:pyridoxamine 5'-phosphate oxidase family protein [Actinotalea solisilvae]|uniref:pyridoxamine 5'-phosphate oxidase family protein n=1 Tax=Actinotalea solisilvae TaxID=2072922 RepID=UPI0018F10E22|nr:pyridoxamine 5'-phosphate oxidase family protein [Actinotalea solisilvae]